MEALRVAGLSRSAARKALSLVLSFVAIVTVLAAGRVAWTSYGESRSADAEIVSLKNARLELAAWRQSAATEATARVAALEAASQDALDRRIAEIDASTNALAAPGKWSRIVRATATSGAGDAMLREFERVAQARLLASEREILVQLRDVRIGVRALEARRLAHLEAYAALKQNEFAQASLRLEHPVRVRLPLTAERAQMARLEREHDALLARNQQAHDAYELQRKVNKVASLPERGFERFAQAIDDALRQLDAYIAQRETAKAQSWFDQGKSAVEGVLMPALWILAAIVVTPIAIKAVFYYGLAPLAARRPPVCLLPAAAGSLEWPAVPGAAETERAKISAVALPLALEPSDVLVVHPDFLQSISAGARAETQWLLDRKYPLTSLAAGMRMLTRIRISAGGDHVIVVSATREPLAEVGVLALPEGASFVLQPRALVGALYAVDRPLRITSAWRLLSLHAWLTLQLRYLVFHGPVRLLVKGCRGVRVEPAGSGRAVNQAATIGFSANLRYSTTRSETFAAYLFGQRELLNDRFTGDHGYYAYEEIPDRRRAGGVMGRGLEGLTDSALKVFGV
ncbi:MAG: hypothetical protein IT517_19855 [Burkholderiales bacterium]|nr:hypothetical protein [Burkholderiales bacterium]